MSSQWAEMRLKQRRRVVTLIASIGSTHHFTIRHEVDEWAICPICFESLRYIGDFTRCENVWCPEWHTPLTLIIEED